MIPVKEELEKLSRGRSHGADQSEASFRPLRPDLVSRRAVRQQDLPESFGRRLLPRNGQEAIIGRRDIVCLFRRPGIFSWPQPDRQFRCWRRESDNSARGATRTRAGISSSRLRAIWRPIHQPNARSLQTADIARRLMRGGELHKDAGSS